ncbi:hypothetical protein MCETALH18_01587 [Methylophilaceae bacterium]
MANISKNLKATAIFMLIFVVLPASALHQLIGVNIKIVYVLSMLSLLLIMHNKIRNKLSLRTAFMAISFLTFVLIASLISNNASQLLLGLSLLLMYSVSKLTVISDFFKHSSNFAFKFTVTLLFGAWIGFFYTLMGGEPLICIDNPDGRLNCLYLTTFSNSDSIDFWRLIRPSGIFDEAGALSFFAILMVCLNELYDGGKPRSFVLLSLGLVTLSLAHILCFLTYVTFFFRKQMVFILLACVLFMGSLVNSVSKDSLLYLNLFQRFTINEDGRLNGDNRSNQIDEFFSLLDNNISRYGNNVIVNEGGQDAGAIDQSSNPFSIWYSYGVLMWMTYAIVLGVLSYHMFDRNKSVQITSILLIMLLLQRPYIYSFYWGLAICTVIALMFENKFSKSTNSRLKKQAM